MSYRKNNNQLKGGSGDCPFYGTFYTFEPITVHSQEHLSDPKIKEDYPINLDDEELLDHKTKLPHMRFLMNDSAIFELTVMLLYEGIRIGNQGNSEKDKMRSTFDQILHGFMSVDSLKQI
mmetsp:Transcript_33824/g.32936  ORF Transcript_33824/g.32936 Transcript_33824/m.32936 type:complete len:120 (+) Transcript_33824:1667-2026(+)